MYIAVCDDLLPELEAVTNLLQIWQEKHKTTLKYKTFRSAAELLDAAEREAFTLCLLDIMMPGVNGLAAARELRALNHAAEIVFLTTTPDFAYESYGVHALDYLLKPIRGEMLFPVLDRLFLREQQLQDALTLKCGSALVRLPYSQLVYVEVNNKHLYFNLADGQQREVAGSLKDYESLLLSRPEFMQIHRSYIVNTLQIQELSPTGVHTFTGKQLPISRRLYPELQKRYIELFFSERE